MLEFQYNLPVNILFGRGKSDSIGQCAAPYGKRALIVTGGNSTKRSGLLEKTERLLHAAGITTVLFDKVTPNPLTTTVLLGAELANRDHGRDQLVLEAAVLTQGGVGLGDHVGAFFNGGQELDLVEIDEFLNACFKIMKPISTMPEGVTDATPDACSPSRASDWMIELAKVGP